MKWEQFKLASTLNGEKDKDAQLFPHKCFSEYISHLKIVLSTTISDDLIFPMFSEFLISLLGWCDYCILLKVLLFYWLQDRVIPFPKALDEEQSKLLGTLVEPVEKYFLEKGKNFMCFNIT